MSRGRVAGEEDARSGASEAIKRWAGHPADSSEHLLLQSSETAGSERGGLQFTRKLSRPV